MNYSLSGRARGIALWVAKAAVGAPFILFGAMKLFEPISTLSAQMPWTGQLPELFVRLLGGVDVAGGLGLLLPGITGIRPGLTRAAAACSLLLQAAATTFHLLRGEAAVVPLNCIFIALLVIILRGSSRPAPPAKP